MLLSYTCLAAICIDLASALATHHSPFDRQRYPATLLKRDGDTIFCDNKTEFYISFETKKWLHTKTTHATIGELVENDRPQTVLYARYIPGEDSRDLFTLERDTCRLRSKVEGHDVYAGTIGSSTSATAKIEFKSPAQIATSKDFTYVTCEALKTAFTCYAQSDNQQLFVISNDMVNVTVVEQSWTRAYAHIPKAQTQHKWANYGTFSE